MSASVSHSLKFFVAGLAVVTSFAIAVLAFNGWMRHSTDIFLSAIQSGMAWCL